MDVVIPYFGGKSGMLHYTSSISNALSQYANVHVILGNLKFEQEFNDSINIIPVSTQSDLYTIMQAKSKINAISPDVLHVTGNHYLEIGLSLFIRNCVNVFTLHNPTPHLGMESKIYDYPARIIRRRLGDIIFVHGSSSRSEAIKQGYPPEKLHVVPHGLYSRFKTDKNYSREKYVLFFGKIRPNKGFDRIPEIASVVCNEIPDAKIVVAGSPENAVQVDDSQVNNTISALENEKKIEFEQEYIPDDEVSSYFSKASVVVLPYYTATQSGVAMIAKAFNTPLIATNVGDLPEIIDHGKTGYIAESTEEISQYIIKLLKNKEEVERIEKNISDNKDRYKWKNISRQLYKVYGSAAGNNVNK